MFPDSVSRARIAQLCHAAIEGNLGLAAFYEAWSAFGFEDQALEDFFDDIESWLEHRPRLGPPWNEPRFGVEPFEVIMVAADAELLSGDLPLWRISEIRKALFKRRDLTRANVRQKIAEFLEAG